jgi:hypothetical protein
MAKQKIEAGRGDKLFGGVATPEEVHVAALAQRCGTCGSPAVITYKSFAPLEFVVDNPQFAMQLAQKHEGSLPVVDTKFGKFVRTGMSYACKRCERDSDREAAKHPSWCFVEIDRGPGAEKVIA